MIREAYYWIAVAYASIAIITIISLFMKGYNGYIHKQRTKYMVQASVQRTKYMDYVLHALHIPPYMIAAYWYYDAYKNYK